MSKKHSLFQFLCGVVLFLIAASTQAKSNVVIVMADDLGWSDTSNSRTTLGHFSDFYETPAIDRLAVEGMAFTNAYVCQNCAPTRSAILTGQYAPRPTNNVYQVGNLNRGGKETLLVGPAQGLPNGKDGIPVEAVTYAEMLQQAGYATGHFGKFHATDHNPQGAIQIVSNHGFDANFGGAANGAPGNYHAKKKKFGPNIGPELDAYAADYTQVYVDKNIKPYSKGTSAAAIKALVGTGKHVSDAMADAAIEFMEQHKAGPFLVQFHPYAVHTPINKPQARSDLLDKYQRKPVGSSASHAPLAALIEGMDQSIARLVDYLKSTPDPTRPGQTLHENTLVIVFSDNGGKLKQSNNGPLKGQKGELDEGGIRVPMIVWSGNPELVDAGSTNHTPVLGIDLYKTLITLAEAEAPQSVTLDGEDLTRIFANRTDTLDREGLYWHLPGYLIGGGRDQRPQSVVRSGKWKLLYNYEDLTFELYDLETDLSEANNLVLKQPAVAEKLGLQLMRWLASVNAPLARLRKGQLQVDVTGKVYRYGRVTDAIEPFIVHAGEAVPMVVRQPGG